jgi:hypothetical protein
MAERVKEANTIDQLIAVIGEVGPIKSSNGINFPISYLQKAVKIVYNQKKNGYSGASDTEEKKIQKDVLNMQRRNEDPLELITRTYGLRDKVIELIGKRK